MIASSMESFAARLASFEVVRPATKKRASDTKGTRTLKWPHKDPSPPQLAQAGFFYQPTSSCPDNTTCYLCNSNLDGWEEDDDPIEEHLKHSPSCGWAITASIERDIEGGDRNVENPMSEKILDARRMTFNSNWPHESKRGWLCKTQKMIDAGWYYCPTIESDDFVKCSYCSLSLDGWEPKDNPHEEHQRRSPDCIFFTLSAPIKSQGGRSKRGRASKASRLSTQSNFTAASKDASIAETELHVNETVPSTTEDTRESKAKGNKKASKSKKPAAKPKSKSKPSELEVEEPVLASSYIEPEDDDFEVKVDIQPTSLARAGKKRNSDEMNAANVGGLSTEADKTIRQPPPKRRATRTRSSVAPESTPLAPSQQNEVGDIHMTDAEDAVASSVPALGKAGKRGKKRASSTARKASTTSTASKASLRLAIPDDEDLDAALELDLDRPLTDEEGNADSLEPVQPKGRRLTRSKPAPLKGMASVASTRRGTRASTITIDDSSIEDVAPSWPTAMKAREASLDVPEPEADVKDSIMEPKTKGKGIRKTATRKVSKKAEAQDDVAQKENEQARPEGTDIFNDTAAPKAPKPQGRQTSRQLPARTTRTSSSATSHTAATLDHHLNSSMLDAQTAEDDSGHETDASVATQGPGKRVGRGKGVKKPKKAKAGKNGPLMSSNIEDVVHPKMNKTDNEAVVVEIDAQSSDQPADEAPEEPRKAGRKAKVGAKTSKGKKSAPKPGAAPTQSPTASPKEKQPIAAFVEDFPTAPSAQITHSTPPLAPSPQSSDAENQPPSSRPSALRPPLAVKSPFTSQPAHIPVAISTPTASPSKGSFSKLHSTMPWTAIDLEQIFSGTPSANQENNPFTLGVGLANGALTSPERGLTVEQWIQFNAQRGEEGLRAECERLVGKFEGEGMRALRTLEGIVCAE